MSRKADAELCLLRAEATSYSGAVWRHTNAQTEGPRIRKRHQVAYRDADVALQRAAILYVAELVRTTPGAIGYAGSTLEVIAEKISKLEPLGDV